MIFSSTAFHEDEIKQFHELSCAKRKVEFVASRWAVKEATFKAFGGTPRLLFPEIVLDKRFVHCTFLLQKGASQNSLFSNPHVVLQPSSTLFHGGPRCVAGRQDQACVLRERLNNTWQMRASAVRMSRFHTIPTTRLLLLCLRKGLMALLATTEWARCSSSFLCSSKGKAIQDRV